MKKRLDKMSSSILEIEDDPILTFDQWCEPYDDFHQRVVQTFDIDRQWLMQNQPQLYSLIKSREHELDTLGDARLSQLLKSIGDWRALIERAYCEQKEWERKQINQGQ